MLSKQAWRFTVDSSSLASRVFKARYFPNSSFLEAKMGSNPSYIWRSIMETQGVVAENLRKRVGNGREVQVWADAWLPGPGSGRVSSPKPVGIMDMNVAALRTEDGKNWSVERVRSIFSQEDSRKILSIPISMFDKADIFWWNPAKDGRFSVRSCYKVLASHGSASTWEGWSRMWNLNVPPKIKFYFWQVMQGCLPSAVKVRSRGVLIPVDCKLCGREEETDDHILHLCPTAQIVWRAAGVNWNSSTVGLENWIKEVLTGMDEEGWCRFLMILWSLWKRRNAVVWKNVSQEDMGVRQCAEATLQSWREVQTTGQQVGIRAEHSEDKWRSPRPGWIKINVDAAVDEQGGVRAWGWIGRNSQGEVVGAYSESKLAGWTPAETEARGIREAIVGAIRKGWRQVEVESDALQIVQAVKKVGDLSYLDLVVDDIRELLKVNENFTLSFCKRSVNRAAHAFARATVLSSDRSFTQESLPFRVVSQLANDLIL
ncbi:unnamed protein product [Cuscuta epithymum]|uniref:Reverse transcriptase zinc-binding domain-containing protein n=1 Tax=Cuscuta epithymum TaxID=186058 RepID=A0AAV0F0L5_9ASTE|nr:unnamed protein product [Cuscuta epithymum]